MSVIACSRQLSLWGATLPLMIEGKDFAVIELPRLEWPKARCAPSPRFRLFVAADVAAVSTDVLSDFSLNALNSGMVYFCAWGNGCERFHDTVDEIVAEDVAREKRFTGPNEKDVIMTTWHDHDSLEDALDFFASCALPTDGFMTASDFRLVMCWGDPQWAMRARAFLQEASFFV
jgi:hypothetical protein